ncbi:MULTISPECIES: hypothetical protein [Streptomyces]|uniref:FXSXX-COOH protein n=1 Tax=Streptomyces solicathayae TaxID=3081768 RepID=A0ABZ0M2N5_9ACTN|nr:hypothetical protein [Streptomyces sp. HUAS YS2]WOX26032.1 hypothetical protein R2D22_33470 [Streptomyces sp. HUAS YS2]
MATTLVSAAARPGTVSRRNGFERTPLKQRVSVLSGGHTSASLDRILPADAPEGASQVEAAFQSAL